MKYRKFFFPVLTLFWLGFSFSTPATAASPVYPYPDIQDGQLATQVVLTLVDGVAVGPDGALYISHRSKNRIRKVRSDGVITTIAGNGIAGYSGDGGPALEASLNFPAGLTFDASGNLYIADRNNHRVRKVDPDGLITTVAGDGVADWGGDNGPAVEAHLNYPSDVAVGPEGHLYISDRSNNRIRKVDADGIITTVAGLGIPDFGGDFGLARDALLKYPFGIHLDAEGNLYVADRGNNRVRKVDSRGIITTIAGDGMHSYGGDYGPAIQASLAYPTDVVTDEAGNLYIADRNNNRIRKVDPFGVITTFMGTGKTHYNGDNEIAAETNLHLPFALALRDNRDLIVVDRSNFRVRTANIHDQAVRTVAGNGESLFKGDGGPGRGATLGAPTGIGVDSRGNVIFSEKLHHRIRMVYPNGIIDTFAGTGSLGNEGNGGPAREASIQMPSSLAIDEQDNVYVTVRQGNSWIIRIIDADGIIRRFAGNGKQGREGDGGPAREASFFTISDIAADGKGRLYIADAINKNIRQVGPDGIITAVVGAEQLQALDEEVHPSGLALKDDGDIYFSDSGSSKIRKFDRETGRIETVAGTGDFEDYGDGGPALKAGIRSPRGLAFGPDGALYVAETQSARIRKIDKAGRITTVVGTGEPGFSGDGGPATQAQVKNPFHLAFDDRGNLYFTDQDNHRVRKVDPDGLITTLAGHGNFGWMQDGLEVRITVQNFP